MREPSTRGESLGIVVCGRAATWEKETMRRMPWTIALLAAAIFLLAPAKTHAQQYTGASTTIRCRSTDGRFRHCPVNGWVRGAQLTRQIGGGNCSQGRSWGYDDRGVWVDRGCQGEFQVWTGGRPSGRSTVVRCSSQDGGRKTCPAGGRVANALVEQRSAVRLAYKVLHGGSIRETCG